MKHLLPTALAFLLVVGCGPDEKTQALLDKMDDRIVTLENAQTNNNTRLDQIEQEQTFVYKDLSTLIPKVRMHDSIVMKRQFQRDFWGKAGAFSRGVIGL